MSEGPPLIHAIDTKAGIDLFGRRTLCGLAPPNLPDHSEVVPYTRIDLLTCRHCTGRACDLVEQEETALTVWGGM